MNIKEMLLKWKDITIIYSSMYWLDFSPISKHFTLPVHVDLVSAPQSKNTVKEITVSMINHVHKLKQRKNDNHPS